MTKQRTEKQETPVAAPLAAPLVHTSAKQRREVMLKPGWPWQFHRTVAVGDTKKILEFSPGEPVEVTDEEFAGLSKDIGICLFEIERDEKGRARAIERTPPTSNPTAATAAKGVDREHKENVENV